MRKFQKHISSLFLIILASPIITCLTLLLYSAWIEHEMFERMESENLEVVSLHPSEIIWKKANRELKIGSDYFDVKYAVRKSDHIEFHGIFDRKEKELEKVWQKSLSHNQHSHEKNNVFQFMQKLKFTETKYDSQKTLLDCQDNLFVDFTERMYASPSLEKTSPPPNRHIDC